MKVNVGKSTVMVFARGTHTLCGVSPNQQKMEKVEFLKEYEEFL